MDSFSFFSSFLAKCELGDKYVSPDFAAETEFLAGLVLQMFDALEINTCLSGLGIPSDFCVLLDPVSIGAHKFGRHGKVLMVCIGVVDAQTFRLRARMIGAPTIGPSESGPTLRDLLLKCLAEHPAALTLESLESRCALVGGDGAISLGGPEKRYAPGARPRQSTGTAELAWATIHPSTGQPYVPPGGKYMAWAEVTMNMAELVKYRDSLPKVMACTDWDKFHREDAMLGKAVAESGYAQEVFDMAFLLDSLFGHGEGKILFQSVASEIKEVPKDTRGPGGTRKVAGLSAAPGNLVDNYRTHVAALHARMQWARDGHSAQSLAKLHGPQSHSE